MGEAGRQAGRWMIEATRIRREVNLSGASADRVCQFRAAKEIGGRGFLHHYHHCMLCKLSTVGGRGGGWISSAYGEAEAPLGTE